MKQQDVRTPSSPDLERRMADALRMLGVDAVERANSGHPGAPMGMADIAQVLWHRHLKHNPGNRVVSMPCTARFDRQPAAYREQVLPLRLPAVAVEAAQPDFWHKYVGREGAVIGIASFGESAPAKDLYAHFGITAAHVAQQVRRLVQQRPPHPVLAPAVELAPAK